MRERLAPLKIDETTSASLGGRGGILKMKGYDFTYQEYAGDHGYASWFEPFVEGITDFFKE